MNDKPETQFGRRSVLLGAGALALGAGMAPNALAASEPALAATFVKAVDVSWAPQMEAKGYSWKNASGQTQDLLAILKGYGISAVRLRTFVNPSSSATDGHCSINEVAAFASGSRRRACRSCWTTCSVTRGTPWVCRTRPPRGRT